MKENKQEDLRKTIGLWSATAINVGAIIGSGIFVVTGIVAGLAGSALVISMGIAAAVALLTALSFVRLTAWQPIEGSGYEYVRQLISPTAGFLSGWMWIVANTFGGAAVSLGFAYYLTSAIPEIPPKAVAAWVCLVFTALNYVGTRQSAFINSGLVIAKLALLGFFVVFGIIYIHPPNFMPFEPLGKGVLFGAYFIFFAYGGFARATIIAEEIKDAKRNVPRAIFLALAISTVVYLLVGIVAVGLVGSDNLASANSPLSYAIGATGNPVAVQIISIGGLLATATVLLTSILGVSRMIFSMARRRDLPQALSILSAKFGTPHISIWSVGLAMVVLVLFADLSGIVVVSTFALLFWYVLVNAASLKLERNNMKLKGVMPMLGLITCLILLCAVIFVAPFAWITGVAFILIGITFYSIRKRSQNSQLQPNKRD